MPKVSLEDIHNLTNEQSVTGTINANMERIEQAMDKSLSRDGSSPNAMEADFDMNSNRILNLPLPVANTEPVRKGEFDVLDTTVGSLIETAEDARDAALEAQQAAETAQGLAEAAQAAAEQAETNAETAETNAEAAQLAAEQAQAAAEQAETNAETAETNAETAQGLAEAAQLAAENAQGLAEAAQLAAEQAETNAETAETNAESAQLAAENARDAAIQAKNEAEIAADNFDDVYLGTKTADPTLDNDGDALVTGQLYFNSTSDSLKVYDGSTWLNYTAATGLASVADDPSPTLGANLDVNGFDIPGFVKDAEIDDLVTGPASATDNTIPRYDGATGKLLQTSGVTVDDSNNISGVGTLACGGITTTATMSISPASGTVGLEIGDTNGAGTPYIDFHSGSSGTDYDARIIASGGTGSSGGGTLSITAGSFTWKGSSLLVASDIGSSVQAYDATILKQAQAATGIEFASSELRMTANQRTATIFYVIDGGGSAITTGVKGDLRVPFACTITAAEAVADQSGSIVVDVWKDTFANYPPTDADSITSSAPVTISSSTKVEDTTLTGWTKSVAAGDCLRFNVDSATTVQRVTVMLKVLKT